MALIPGLRIEEIYAYTAIDPDDNIEGIVSAQTGVGLIPLVGADIERMLSYKEVAQAAADETGAPIKLVRFSNRQEIETL